MGRGGRELSFAADDAPQSGRLADRIRDGAKSLARTIGYDIRRVDSHLLKRPIDFIRCLSQFLGVQMELPIIHLYEGTWQFHEAVAYMCERGFEISNIVPVNYDRVDSVSLLEVDCVFCVRRR